MRAYHTTACVPPPQGYVKARVLQLLEQPALQAQLAPPTKAALQQVR